MNALWVKLKSCTIVDQRIQYPRDKIYIDQKERERENTRLILKIAKLFKSNFNKLNVK